MSECRWCDYGGHPFKGGRKGTIVMGRVEEALSNNEYVTASQMRSQEICPECAAVLGMNDDYKAPESPDERRKNMLEQVRKHG